MPRRRRGAKIVSGANEEVPSEAQDSVSVGEEDDSAEETSSPEDSSSKGTDSKKYSDLKDLIFLGRLEETVEFSGFNFRLKTLNTKEQRGLVEKIMSLTEAERFARVRDYTMAQVIDTVNNVPLERMCTDEDIEDLYDQRLSVISAWQATLVDFLYAEYEKLFSRSNESFGEDDLKK